MARHLQDVVFLIGVVVKAHMRVVRILVSLEEGILIYCGVVVIEGEGRALLH